MTGRQGGSGFWRHATAFRRLAYVVSLLVLLLMAAALFMPRPATLSSLPKATVSSITVVAMLDSFPLAANAWRDELDLDGEVPASGYAAYYLERYRLDDNKRRRIIAREQVPRVDIHYTYDGFHDIPSEQFDGYWVRRLQVPQRAVYSLFMSGVSSSTGHVCLIIDGRQIVAGVSEDLPDNLLLEAGEHIVEVEYSNLWHTTDFSFNIRPSVPVMPSPDVLAPSLQALQLPADTVVFLVFASHNDANYTVPLYIDETRPYILLLQGGGLSWEIHGTPLAIVSNSIHSDFYASGSPPVFFWQKYLEMPIEPFYASNCRCQGSDLDCPDNFDKITAIVTQVQQWTGYPLAGAGFTADNRVPHIHTDKASLQQQREAFARFQAEESRKCAAIYQEQRKGMQRRFDDVMPRAAH